MNKSLNVGIAGLGIVGKRRRELIDLHENLSLVAVCDQSLTCDGSTDDGVKYFSNIKDLLNEDLDVLFVCLPNDLAADVTIAGLENNFHVFCEKPPGRDLEDIARVRSVERCKEGLKLMYGFNHRYHSSVEKALKYVKDGALGRLINIQGTYGKSQIAGDKSDWRANRLKSGGGILLDQGIHMLDIFRLFAGEFKEVHSFISNDFWNHDVEDNAYALMKSESGVIAFIHSSATQWTHTFHIELTYERGSIILSGILSGSMTYSPETVTFKHRDIKDHESPVNVRLTFIEDNSWWKEICAFTDAILNNKPIESGSSLDAYNTMELVYKIYCADFDWKNKYGLCMS